MWPKISLDCGEKNNDPDSRGFAHVHIRDEKDAKKEENAMVRKRVARRGTHGSRGGYHRHVDPARQLAQQPLVFLCTGEAATDSKCKSGTRTCPPCNPLEDIRMRSKNSRGIGRILGQALTCVAMLAGAGVCFSTADAATFNIPNGDVVALIAAINTANGNGQANTINLAPGGTYTLIATDNSSYYGTTGLPIITSSITINGNGATIQRSSATGTPDFRIFLVSGDLTLNRLTITGGRGSGGGGLLIFGGLTAVVASAVSGNFGLDGGGGIFVYDGSLIVLNSTISYNVSFGGFGGGGIFSRGSSTIINSTIFENRADAPPGFRGRGDAIAGPANTVKNSILASPTQGLGDACSGGAPTSLGHNIAGDVSCGLTGTGDRNSTNPLLGPLANNGGPTMTHAPLPGSPAIDAVPNQACTDLSGTPLATDQRGVARPQGGGCDIGSVEFSQATQCYIASDSAPTVRATGLTELLGDIVINCYGGTPTTVGTPVPQNNIQVFLNTNLTSRITSSPFTEVLMLIDEPHSLANPTIPLLPCDPANTQSGVCSILGTGTGAGTYNGSPGRPNVFQARQASGNSVSFVGVPIDPPGTSGARTIRIANLRGNANQLGAVPTQIVAFISISGTSQLPLINPQHTVAIVAPGLSYSFTNTSIRLQEGFLSAWREKNIQTHIANTPPPPVWSTVPYPYDAAQDVPSRNYFSESGFEVNGVSPWNLAPPGYGPFLSANNAFPSARSLNHAGTADVGTRLYVRFSPPPNGFHVPTRISLTNVVTGLPSGFAVLVNTNSNGDGTYLPVAGNAFTGQAPVDATTGLAVYEILSADPFSINRMEIPIKGLAMYLHRPGWTVSAGFAPFSAEVLASPTGSIPRFAP